MPKITGTPEDREQIRELYARYAIYVDNERFEDWVQCFTPDGVFDSPMFGKQAGHENLREVTQSYSRSWEGGKVRHMMVNVSFDIDDDTATGFCNLIYFSLKNGKMEIAAVGAYNDKLRKTNGEWRFACREVQIDQ
jgi:3-phenylpropionate/cinnamic acid dioxygenase small subunit